jgi:hypothetical protein
LTTKTLSKLPQIPKRSNSKDTIIVEETSNVATLVEYPITATSSISYYYPYFVKSNLITFADEIDIQVLSTNCTNIGCHYCDPINPTMCRKCHTGFFLFKDSCSTICPIGYFADNLRSKCVPAVTTIEIVYTKAYSIGSCLNACGLDRIDCECSPSCRLKGTCCTDFNLMNCPVIVEIFARQSSDASANKNEDLECGKKNIGCKFCDEKNLIDSKENVKKCNQCKEDYFLYEGRCFEKCPEDTIENNTNKTCEKKPICDIANCGECATATTCKTCKNGYFKFGNECNSKCPEGYRADRITWTCLEPPIFAWYWVYPSRSSCRNYCGIVIQKDWDCSCSSDCFFFGNCCQDIDYYCDALLFWRKKGNKLRQSNSKKINAIENKPNPAIANNLPSIKPLIETNINVNPKKPEIVKINAKKSTNTITSTNTSTSTNTNSSTNNIGQVTINKNINENLNEKKVEVLKENKLEQNQNQKVIYEKVVGKKINRKLSFRNAATNTDSEENNNDELNENENDNKNEDNNETEKNNEDDN